MLLRKFRHNDLLGSEVDHSSCVERIMHSITAVELPMNQLLIDVRVGLVSSTWKLIFLSPAEGCGSRVAYMHR